MSIGIAIFWFVVFCLALYANQRSGKEYPTKRQK